MCNEERKKLISYKEYLKSFNNCGYYACSKKCAYNKNKKTNLHKYGVENYSQSSHYRKKIKKTSLEKHGVEHYSKTQEYKEKVKNTLKERYGVDNISKCNKFKKKRKKTMLERYGVEYYVLHNDFKDKSKETFLKNYGVEHIMKLDREVEKRLKKKGLILENNLYKIYRRKVDKMTKQSKIILLNKWDGYDFYDNEYIKYNFELDYTHSNYPTIDHKISVYEGFKNNLSIEEMSSVENLCITKRWINSSKYIKNAEDFIKILDNS